MWADKKSKAENRKGQYLCHVIGAALVVGELEFAERHFLSHPVSSCVGRVGVHVHPVPYRLKKHTMSIIYNLFSSKYFPSYHA